MGSPADAGSPLAEICRRSATSGKTKLNEAELHFAGFADHMLIPGWVPDQLNVGFVNARNREDL
jgi:hypothetical protein